MALKWRYNDVNLHMLINQRKSGLNTAHSDSEKYVFDRSMSLNWEKTVDVCVCVCVVKLMTDPSPRDSVWWAFQTGHGNVEFAGIRCRFHTEMYSEYTGLLTTWMAESSKRRKNTRLLTALSQPLCKMIPIEIGGRKRTDIADWLLSSHILRP